MNLILIINNNNNNKFTFYRCVYPSMSVMQTDKPRFLHEYLLWWIISVWKHRARSVLPVSFKHKETPQPPSPFSVLIHNGQEPASSGCLSPWRQGWEAEWWCCWQKSRPNSAVCAQTCGKRRDMIFSFSEWGYFCKIRLCCPSSMEMLSSVCFTKLLNWGENKELVSMSSAIDWWSGLWHADNANDSLWKAFSPGFCVWTAVVFKMVWLFHLLR